MCVYVRLVCLVVSSPCFATLTLPPARLHVCPLQTLTQLQKLQDLEFVGDLSDTVVTRTPLLSRMASGSSNSSSSSSRARMSSSLMDADCMDDMTVMGGGSGSGAASARQQQAGARGAARMERSGGRSSSGGGGNTGYALAAHSCKSVLTFLPQLSSLNSLVLEQWTGSFMGAAGEEAGEVAVVAEWALLEPSARGRGAGAVMVMADWRMRGGMRLSQRELHAALVPC